MPRTYKRGKAPRPGDDAGLECEAVGCTITESSGWSKGICASCRAKAVRESNLLGTSKVLADVSNEVEAVLRRSNYAAAAAAMATGGPMLMPLLPMVQATVVPERVEDEARPDLADPQAVADAERRAVAAEARAVAADARAAEATAKLERVLQTVVDELFADLGKRQCDQGVPVRRVKRRTGLSCAELRPHDRAMKVIDSMCYDCEHEKNVYWRDQ